VPRKLEELVLDWDRIFPVPGRGSVWAKYGLAFVPPNGRTFFGFTSPRSWRLVVDELVVTPMDQISFIFGESVVIIGNSEHRPDQGIFRPLDGNETFQIEHPDKISIPEGTGFRFEVRNTSPFFFANYMVNARIFTERIAN